MGACRYRFICLVYVLVLALPAVAGAQYVQQDWVRYYLQYNVDYDYVSDVTIGADSAVLVAGMVEDNMALVSYSLSGVWHWRAMYRGSDSIDYGQQNALAVLAMPDSGCVVTGWSQLADESGGELFCIRYNSVGDTVWTASYSSPDSLDAGMFVVSDDSGNIFVAGHGGSPGPGNHESHFVTIKYDGAGVELWHEIFEAALSPYAPPTDLGVDGSGCAVVTGGEGTVRYDPDGGVLWSVPQGYSYLEIDSDDNIYLSTHMGFYHVLKLAPNGDTAWTTNIADTCGLPNFGSVRDLVLYEDSILYLSTDCGLFALDTAGSRLWDRPDVTGNIAADAQGGVYTAEQCEDPDGILVHKTAASGSPRWQYQFSSREQSGDDPRDIVIVDGQVIVAGICIIESEWQTTDIVTFSLSQTGPYVCGDVDGNMAGPDIADLIYLVTSMFQEGPEPRYPAIVDIDQNGEGPDIADLIYLVTFMFQEGPDLPACP